MEKKKSLNEKIISKINIINKIKFGFCDNEDWKIDINYFNNEFADVSSIWKIFLSAYAFKGNFDVFI
ncbi:hypothetical protein KA977_07610 [Candidatus Dependentiae bacterium]|nr:hypothetical protein [Candidatus Dependentiae bacterium]